MRECHLPVDLEDIEKVVRAIKTPYYFGGAKKDRLLPKALYPPPGSRYVSLVRGVCGDDFCADRARETAKLPQEYSGLFVVSAGNIRATTTAVFDHREDYCGHAHMDSGVVMPARGESQDPRETLALKTRCQQILDAGTYHPDPVPSGPGWSGPPL